MPACRLSITIFFSPSRRRSTSSNTRAKLKQMSADQFYAFTAATPIPSGRPTCSGRPALGRAGRSHAASAATATTPATNLDTSQAASNTAGQPGPPWPKLPSMPLPHTAASGPTPGPGPAINPNDITEHETYNYAAGGIWPQIVGTVLLVIGSMAIALVLGVFSAVYLSEYSRRGRSSAPSGWPSSTWPACLRLSSACSAWRFSSISWAGISRCWRAGSPSRSWSCR